MFDQALKVDTLCLKQPQSQPSLKSQTRPFYMWDQVFEQALLFISWQEVDAHKLGFSKGTGQFYSWLAIHKSLVRICFFFQCTSTSILPSSWLRLPKSLFLMTRFCFFVLARSPSCVATTGVWTCLSTAAGRRTCVLSSCSMCAHCKAIRGHISAAFDLIVREWLVSEVLIL